MPGRSLEENDGCNRVAFPDEREMCLHDPERFGEALGGPVQLKPGSPVVAVGNDDVVPPDTGAPAGPKGLERRLLGGKESGNARRIGRLLDLAGHEAAIEEALPVPFEHGGKTPDGDEIDADADDHALRVPLASHANAAGKWSKPKPERAPRSAGALSQETSHGGEATTTRRLARATSLRVHRSAVPTWGVPPDGHSGKAPMLANIPTKAPKSKEFPG